MLKVIIFFHNLEKVLVRRTGSYHLKKHWLDLLEIANDFVSKW